MDNWFSSRSLCQGVSLFRDHQFQKNSFGTYSFIGDLFQLPSYFVLSALPVHLCLTLTRPHFLCLYVSLSFSIILIHFISHTKENQISITSWSSNFYTVWCLNFTLQFHVTYHILKFDNFHFWITRQWLIIFIVFLIIFDIIL